MPLPQQLYCTTASGGAGASDEIHPFYQYKNPREARFYISKGPGAIADVPYYRTSNESKMEIDIHRLEQDAYAAVLRAFKIQADTISWEKASLMSNLRDELKVSDEEHKKIRDKIDMDGLIQRIRDWRQASRHHYRVISAPNTVFDTVPSTTLTGPMGMQRIAQSVPHHAFDVSPSFSQPQAVYVPNPQPSLSVKRGHLDVNKHRNYPSSGSYIVDTEGIQISSNIHKSKTAGVVDCTYLLGQKVRIRSPYDNNFYHAVISRYDPVRGLHALSFDFGSENENLEWVNLSEIPPRDIQWVDDKPDGSLHSTNTTSLSGRYRLTQGRSIHIPKSQFKPKYMKGPGWFRQGAQEVKIRKTDELIETVTRVFSAGNADPYTLGNAKQALKEHEKALVQVLESLSDLSDDE